MGNIVLQPTHLKLLNAYMLNGGMVKEAAKTIGMVYGTAKAVMRREDVQSEMKRRQHRMGKRNEDQVEKLKERILEEALWIPPSLAGITENPQQWLEDHAGQAIYGQLNIVITPGRGKNDRKKVSVTYKSPSINEIVALRQQAIELMGLKKLPEGEGDEYILIQKLNAGRARMGETPSDE